MAPTTSEAAGLHRPPRLLHDLTWDDLWPALVQGSYEGTVMAGSKWGAPMQVREERRRRKGGGAPNRPWLASEGEKSAPG